MADKPRRIPIGTPVRKGIPSWLAESRMMIFGARPPVDTTDNSTAQDDGKRLEEPEFGSDSNELRTPNED